MIKMREQESTIITVRNERGNSTTNPTAVRKDKKNTVLSEKKHPSAKKEATGYLYLRKKGK